jgi:hypothetical protein
VKKSKIVTQMHYYSSETAEKVIVGIRGYLVTRLTYNDTSGFTRKMA